MYAAVAADEILDPFNSNRRVPLSSSKQLHISQLIQSRTDSDIPYKGVEMPLWTTNALSKISDARIATRRKQFWRDTKDELKTVQWSTWLWRFVALMLPVVLMLMLLLLTIWICIPGAIFRIDDVCRPDGSFYYGLSTYDPWHTESLFQIDVGFGHFSYGNAKLIDFWWDLLVGRGGQVIMAFVAYKACTKSLIRHMEVHAVPTETFEAISIQDHSMTGLLKLVKGTASNRDARSIASMIWFILGAAYVLLFPSFVSAMSGYSANVEAYIEVDSGPLVPWAEFEVVRYIIHDGNRLGGPFYDNYIVTVPESSIQSAWYGEDWAGCYSYVNYNYDNTYHSGYQNPQYQLDEDATAPCKLLWTVAMYGNQSGYLGLNESSSVFNNSGHLINLTSPTLNITAYFAKAYKASQRVALNGATLDYYASSGLYTTGFYWKNPETGNFTFGDVYNPMLSYDNKTYNDSQIGSSGHCQQTSVEYKWGFCFILLFSLLISLVIWCIGMYTTYVDSYLHSRLDLTARHLGLQRAALDLASAMEPYVPKDQHNVASNSKVKELIAGSHITYVHLVSDLALSTRAERLKTKWQAFKFSRFIKHDKWWFSFTVLISLLWMASWYPLPFLPPLIANTILLAGFVMLLYAGPESKARWLIFVVAVAVYAILTGLAMSKVAPHIFYHANPVYIMMRWARLGDFTY